VRTINTVFNSLQVGDYQQPSLAVGRRYDSSHSDDYRPVEYCR